MAALIDAHLHAAITTMDLAAMARRSRTRVGIEAKAILERMLPGHARDGGRTYEGKWIYSEPTPVNRRTAFLWAGTRRRRPPERDDPPGLGAALQRRPAGDDLEVRSVDGGRTWSEPQKDNDVAPPRKLTYMELFFDASVAPNDRVDIEASTSRGTTPATGARRTTPRTSTSPAGAWTSPPPSSPAVTRGSTAPRRLGRRRHLHRGAMQLPLRPDPGAAPHR